MALIDALSRYVVVPAAALYLIGWIYLYNLCWHIGIDIALLKISTHTIIVNSYNVLFFFAGEIAEIAQSYWIQSTVILLVSIGISRVPKVHQFLIAHYPSFSRTLSGIQDRFTSYLPVQFLLYIGFLLAVSLLSKSAALAALAEVPNRPGARTVFQFSDAFLSHSMKICRSDEYCEFTRLNHLNARARLRMIMQSPDYFVVWAQPSEPDNTSFGDVFLIKTENVDLAIALNVETKQYSEEQEP